jgi:hypothetical protein
MSHLSDIQQIQEKGISPEALEEQLNRFKKGFASLKIDRPATPGDGIVALTDQTIQQFSKTYIKEIANNLAPLKFVPASGAATRMFKAFFQYLGNPVDVDSLDKEHPINEFILELPSFPFFQALKGHLAQLDLDYLEVRKSHAKEIVQTLLSEKGLNYGALPKGLLLFHNYPNGARTSMMEHLLEGADYAKDAKGRVNLHFTVSTEHLGLFEEELAQMGPQIKKESGATFSVSFSSQKPHTDTVAVLPNNEPYRDSEGRLLFRPGGHGSLIENLNDQDADIIFIKNIDNIVPAHLLPHTSKYKIALAGMALHIRNKVHDFIGRLTQDKSLALIEEIRAFMRQTLFTELPGHLADASPEEQATYLLGYLNRPIRVCGMVKNEGEPGGGPFWVRNDKGQETLQIVESSQIDLTDPLQSKIFGASTHFNPVDLICITKDYRGEKFDLVRYVDPETGFISEKSVAGKTIKALEKPGLWNGAMADWLTLFAEVPGETFNPVKTVNDLLRPGHQFSR